MVGYGDEGGTAGGRVEGLVVVLLVGCQLPLGVVLYAVLLLFGPSQLLLEILNCPGLFVRDLSVCEIGL